VLEASVIARASSLVGAPFEPREKLAGSRR
jgi:hypothetical protein